MLNILIPQLDEQIRPIVRRLRKERCRGVKLWMPKDVCACDAAFKAATDIEIVNRSDTGIGINHRLRCFEWDINNVCVRDTCEVFRYLIEHSRRKLDDNWIVLTSVQHQKGQISLFYDGIDAPEYPNEWYTFKCISNNDEYNSYVADHNFIIFRLCKGDRFDIAHDQFKHTHGAQVYKERDTGYYWYIDTFHKNHCEVFDETGRTHLGIADIKDGKLDRTKSDLKKLPIL